VLAEFSPGGVCSEGFRWPSGHTARLVPVSLICSSILANMEVDDLVRIGAGGISQFRVLEIDEERALIETTLDCPGKYPFSLPFSALFPDTRAEAA
jgi:hypothetical protein